MSIQPLLRRSRSSRGPYLRARAVISVEATLLLNFPLNQNLAALLLETSQIPTTLTMKQAKDVIRTQVRSAIVRMLPFQQALANATSLQSPQIKNSQLISCSRQLPSRSIIDGNTRAFTSLSLLERDHHLEWIMVTSGLILRGNTPWRILWLGTEWSLNPKSNLLSVHVKL